MVITLESAVSRILSPVVDMATEERVSQVPVNQHLLPPLDQHGTKSPTSPSSYPRGIHTLTEKADPRQKVCQASPGSWK